jgi:ADP-heptose:LPS heptosyltransferase
MHLAAAAGTAAVVISCHPRDGTPFFLNAPERFGPWGVESVTLQPAQRAGECRATCVAGHPHCILGVTTATVQQAAESMLAGKRMRT